MTLTVYVWQKKFQSQIVKRRHSKHFAFRCLLEFRNLADFKDSEIPIIDWRALSLTNIFLTCKPVYILYINICLYLIYNPRSDLTTITWQGLAQLLRRWLRHWEFGRGTERLDELHNMWYIFVYDYTYLYRDTETSITNLLSQDGDVDLQISYRS